MGRRLGRGVGAVAVAVMLGVGGLAAGNPAPAGAQTGTGTIIGSVGPAGSLAIQMCVVAVGDAGTFQTTADQLTGQFSLEAAPGTYFVWFIPCAPSMQNAVQLYLSASSYDAATPVVVNEASNTPLQAQPAAPPGATIAGQVVDADGFSISDCGVQVITRTPIPTLVGGTTTEPSGAYSIGRLPAGSMDVVVRCGTGFATTYHGDTTDPGAAVPVTTAAGTTVDAVDVTVARTGASVAGTLTTTDGSPAGGACAFALTPDGTIIGASPLRAGGIWAIADLPVGDVRIGFRSCGEFQAYVPEWYNDTEDFAAATPVPVDANSATTGIDAVLVRNGSIFVAFIDPGGNPVSGVCAWLTDATATNLVAVKFVGGEAAVSFDGLRPGTYSALFTDCGSNGFPPEWYADAPDHAGSTPITVTDGAITNLNATLG